MKKDHAKTIVVITLAFVVGVIITVFSYQAVTIYQLRAQIVNDHITLAQVVDFINQGIQAQQNQAQQSQQKTSQASTPAQTGSTSTKK